MPGTRKLGRPTDQRKAMLRGLVTYLLENGKIETTLTRAKEVAPIADKMITLGKKNTLAARRAAMAYITKEDVVKKLFDTIAPMYEERVGGYTQIYKLGPRRGDAAEMALIRLIDLSKPEKEEKAAVEEKPAATKAKSTATKTAAKKPAAKKEEKAADDAVETATEPVAEKPKSTATKAKSTTTKTAAAKKPAAKKTADATAEKPKSTTAKAKSTTTKTAAAKKPAAKKAADAETAKAE